jgi:hypothetical protein
MGVQIRGSGRTGGGPGGEVDNIRDHMYMESSAFHTVIDPPHVK